MIKKVYIFNLFSALFLFVSGIVFVQFLAYHEIKCDKSGILLEDPIIALLPLKDYSIAIFSITYSVLIYGIYLSLKNKLLVGKFMLTYGLMLLLRIITLTIIPLKAPPELIYLQDPFLNNLIYPGQIKNDLFFSGHTALVFIMFFLTKKRVLAIIGILLGLLLMAQRVHYSIDVIGAIPVSYFLVRMINALSAKLTEGIE